MREIGHISAQVEAIKRDIAGFREAIQKLEQLILESNNRIERIEREAKPGNIDVQT